MLAQVEIPEAVLPFLGLGEGCRQESVQHVDVHTAFPGHEDGERTLITLRGAQVYKLSGGVGRRVHSGDGGDGGGQLDFTALTPWRGAGSMTGG